ncbi:MAG: hypothetical protein IPJ03_14890 [Ignavibacteriales bacterium]|nr:hypothetical protein [Ignavibacteriales bacterium]
MPHSVISTLIKINTAKMFEGFDKDWVQAGNIRSATYTNLDPGNYIFKVRACNSSGIWNQAGNRLKIYISTPPWVSWYAYLLCGNFYKYSCSLYTVSY